MRIPHYFTYPNKGFAVVMWIVIAMCVMVGLANTWQLSSWEEVMALEREQMQYRIELLQDYIKDNGGIAP